MQVVMQSPKWRLVLIAGLCVVIVAFCMAAIYVNTRDAYRSVGFNDGEIASKIKMIERINELVGIVTVCTTEQQVKAKEVVNVKSEVLYLMVDDFGKSIFCKSK